MSTNNDNPVTGDGVEKTSFFSSARNKIVVAAGVITLLFAALWIWKAIEIGQLKKENERKEAMIR